MKQSGIRLLLFLLITGLSLTQFACDMKLPPMPWDKKPPAQTEEPPAEEGGKEAPPEEQLDMTKLIPEAMRNLPYSEVTIPMPDGLNIVGRLYDPALTKDEDGEIVTPADGETDYTGPKYPLIILLHGLNLSQAHWQTLPKTLMESGYAVFAMDLRGHGQSTKKISGRGLNWRSLNGDDWTQVYRDVVKVIAYFGTTEDYPEVDASTVGLVGEQLGANVAIWAAKRSDKVHSLVLLTPNMNIKGLDAGKGLIDYPYNTMILVNQDEQDTYSAARYLYGWLQGPKELQVYQHAGAGAEMITAKPAIAYQIRDWLIKVFPPARIPGAALSEEELKKAEDAGKTETAKEPAKH
jgi:pimeloyl-ACP methyl ester carboxylesterase